jgi:hypothetical protein
MALTQLETDIGELGSQLAQAHYALTTDHEGALPMRPTDADRQQLLSLVGRLPEPDEERLFDAGYRESYLRLVAKGGPVDQAKLALHPVLHAELFALIAKYGFVIPPEGTPERDEARLLLSRSIDQLRFDFEKLLPKRPEPAQDGPGTTAAEQIPV